MPEGCPNCDALCLICQDNTWNWHQPLCSSCRLAVAYEQSRIIKLLNNAYRRYTRKSVNGDLIAVGAANATVELIALIKGEK